MPNINQVRQHSEEHGTNQRDGGVCTRAVSDGAMISYFLGSAKEEDTRSLGRK